MGEAVNDKDIREPLFEFLEETFGKIRIIEEKALGRSRADIVMMDAFIFDTERVFYDENGRVKVQILPGKTS